MGKVIAAFAAGLLIFGCQGNPDFASGTEIPNELVGAEILPGKGPAAQAEIRLVPVGHRPGSEEGDAGGPGYKAVADSAGRFRLAGIQPGLYNILAAKDGYKSFRDSVVVTEVGLDLGADTLQVPGSLYGTVSLQPNHDPRSATVQVLGATLFVNVDSAGNFLLPDLAPGRYRLLVEAGLDGYAKLYVPAVARSGMTDTLPALAPFFSGIPVVTGLSASTFTGGTILVSWSRSDYHNLDGYLIYRDSASAILPSIVPIARVGEPYFHDTLFAANPRPGQYLLSDTNVREFTYRVRVLDRGGDIGPAYAKASAVAYSPSQIAYSGAWNKAVDSAAFGWRALPAVVEFDDRLWLIGGLRKEGLYEQDIWSSENGLDWKREADSLPFAYAGTYRAAVFRSRLWVLALEERNGESYPVCWSSGDGREWAREGGPDIPVPQPLSSPPSAVRRTGLAFSVFRDQLWMIGATPGVGVRVSADGVTWTRAAMPDSFAVGSDPEAIEQGGRFLVMGGGAESDTAFPRLAWSTADGAEWLRDPDSLAFLPRIGFSLAAGLKNLYAIGGVRPDGGSGAGFQDLGDQVWVGGIGPGWKLFDTHAPFGKRRYPGIVGFRGRIWLIGGLAAPDSRALRDIWAMDGP